MSALLDTQTQVVVRIADDGSEPTSPSGVTIYAANNDRIAQLLDQILTDPKIVKVISHAGHSTARKRTGAHDFCNAVRLVEQECYQSA